MKYVARLQISRYVYVFIAALLIVLPVSGYVMQWTGQKLTALRTRETELHATLSQTQEELDRLKSEDPRKTNQVLKQEILDLKKTFVAAINVYEDLVKLRESTPKTSALDSLFASALTYLAKENVASADATLKKLADGIKTETTKLAVAVVIPANVPESNAPPSSGYKRQKVVVDGTGFLVDIVAADLNSTKVIIDTASDNTCANNCPVLPLAEYAARSGAYAGINGTYFCPETYPTCADKKNSFDVLVMNKNKVYFNSDNNVYSTVPAVVFSGNSMRLYAQSLQWGRDTGVDAVIANRPLLVQDGNVMFGGNDDAKESLRGNRSFVGGSGNMGYIGVVHGATVAESAKTLQALGIRNAINLDSGGSTALWAGGYKAGPGRNLPNVVLFIRK
ncbi:MAG: hypothetical protein UX35_C0002G0014 [Microgenomates group bacterium GW2011_GWA1_46_15]|nr:MAG: hypothetical protein UX00_C0013G0014 [Microgenomates group bacterium GW2011_GWB1_45_17]KKU23561.1 MAG: hypothetical protein UX36_C0004G0014 [Microgenomates group bacterium GW2011_GWC1_46_15]KKU24280.1 MAG: hypothetical protein UX35_C0002G0014 [Microgenomates group bacterium GW2011_GWA1_46_15]